MLRTLHTPNKHRVTYAHTEMRAKQTTEGGDRDWCVLALGGTQEFKHYGAPLEEWPQRSGFHRDKEQIGQKYTTLPITLITPVKEKTGICNDCNIKDFNYQY